MNIIENIFKTNGIMDTRKRTSKIILHHADSSRCSVEDIDRWHKARGWCKIGYHFFVNKKGEIYRGREESSVGAHAYGSNYESIGICAEGKYMSEKMPEEQQKAIIELINYLKNKYHINIVQKHKDVCDTSCPGDNYPFNEIINSKIIKYNTNDNQMIKKVQEKLNYKYNLNIKTDNIYGNETKGALVYALQKEIGVKQDKIFGPITKAHCPNVRIGSNSNIVLLIQSMLICHGFNIELDGIFGNKTLEAVKEFQRRNGLIIDGIVGKETFNKLFR